VEVKHPFIAPPTCTAYAIAILLNVHCAIYAPPPTLPFYAIHWPLHDNVITNIAWCMAYKREVEEGSYLAQKSWQCGPYRLGGGNEMKIGSFTKALT